MPFCTTNSFGKNSWSWQEVKWVKLFTSISYVFTPYNSCLTSYKISFFLSHITIRWPSSLGPVYSFLLIFEFELAQICISLYTPNRLGDSVKCQKVLKVRLKMSYGFLRVFFLIFPKIFIIRIYENLLIFQKKINVLWAK